MVRVSWVVRAHCRASAKGCGTLQLATDMTIEFCEICDNILYIRSHGIVHPEKFCKHCNFTKGESCDDAMPVSEAKYGAADDLLYEQYRNAHLRHDPALPRVVDPEILCPNKDCVEREGKKFIFVKHQASQMKYFFCCEDCGTTFRRNILDPEGREGPA